MAAKYPSFADAAADDLACPICFQIYVTPHEPKNLPKCSHMCCSLCLKKMTKDGLKTVKCPQCNQVSKLPKEGVDRLITSLTVRNLAEKHPEGIKQRKEYMQREFEQQTHRATEQLNEMVETEQRIQASIDHEVREVEKTVETVMTQAQDRAQDMIKQIKDLGIPKLTETRQKIKQLKQQVNDIEQSRSKLETLTDDEFQTQTDALVNQIEKLKIIEVTNGKEVYSTGKFVTQDIQLGRVVKARVLELASEFGRFDGAYGIASKPNGTLVVSDFGSDPPQALVYNYDNDEYKKQFQFNIAHAQPNNMIDIAVSTDDDYLVTKESASEFDVYSSDGKYQKTMKATDPKQNGVAVSITTTREGRILVGSRIQREGGEHVRVITVHDTAGKILKTIPTSIAPMRIADICGTSVAATAGKENKVCVYDLETGKETMNLDTPIIALGVCHDEESDCLLIGRAAEEDEDGNVVPGSCVIEQYCYVTGKLVAVLARGLLCPAAMTITQDGMLAVADMKTVKVYKMK